MQITPCELFELDVWVEYCDLKGIDPYCISEGLMDTDEVLEISIQDARDLGIFYNRLNSRVACRRWK